MVKPDFQYIIIGGGISGSSCAFELQKHTNSILLIDKLDDVGSGASGAAGAFLSPLLGKPNQFKTLITTALKYSVNFYKTYFLESIDNCGTTRIPKNETDQKKFESYKPYMDFEFTQDEKGYFFPIGSVVNSYELCVKMTKNIEKRLGYEVNNITYKNGLWYIDDQYTTKNLIITTGSCTKLLNQFYINIRPVWGQRIVVETSTQLKHNYHKECSVSKSITKNGKNIVSIGATHHRFVQSKPINPDDTLFLLKKVNDIVELKDVKVIKELAGARASSVDYFPLVGKVIDSQATLNEFPYLKHGTYVDPKRFTRYNNLYLLNGVGGRGFVLAPYLAKILIDHIVDETQIEKSINIDRLFLRAVKKLK